jgi:hypothetical protein
MFERMKKLNASISASDVWGRQHNGNAHSRLAQLTRLIALTEKKMLHAAAAVEMETNGRRSIG